MKKSADAFRTISEVSDWLDTPSHVLRFWESKFPQVSPVKRAGGRRYYRPEDMLLLGGIKKLLHDDGITIKGVQKILKEEGIDHVSSLSPDIEGYTPKEKAKQPDQEKTNSQQEVETASVEIDAGDDDTFEAGDTPWAKTPEPAAEPVFSRRLNFAPEDEKPNLDEVMNVDAMSHLPPNPIGRITYRGRTGPSIYPARGYNPEQLGKIQEIARRIIAKRDEMRAP